jgi:thermopsin
MTLGARWIRGAIALAAIVIVVSFGFSGIADLSGGVPIGVSHSPGAALSGATTAVASPSPSNAGATMAATALAAVHSHDISPRTVSVPRPSATPEQLSEARAAGHVLPLYNATPSPMGVADYGLSAAPNGSVVPSMLNTTSLRGEIETSAAGIHGLDLADSSPDGFGIQLNAVQTNVSLFGTPGYSFWTQDIALYYPDADQLYLDSNVWNWSGGPLTPNVFYEHGPYGVQVDESYYYALIGPLTVTYPFNLTFYLNSSLISGRDSVNFTADIVSSAGTYHEPWDYAVFNSTVPHGARLHAPSNYTANGFSYNPIGLTDDFEMILGGPNGGSQADLVVADATISLAYSSHHHYRAVPSAYGYGGETGETVIGAYVGWSHQGEGPGGTTPYGMVTTGPSILSGLWNAGRATGLTPVHLDLTPSNAFLFLSAARNAFTIPALEYAPTIYTSTLYLSPATYTYDVMLADHTPASASFTVGPGTGPGHAQTLAVTLPTNMNEGVYTPLFAWQNDQLASISYGGAGTPGEPYQLFNNQLAPLSPLFGVVNDYVYPVFSGILLVGTTASVEIDHPATFTTDFVSQFVGSYVNALPLWFDNVSGVAIVHGSNITGWFSTYAYAPPYWTTWDVVFYNSEHNLVAGNTFDVDGGGGLLFFGGGNNTVWGNTFREVAVTSPAFVIPYAEGIGITIAESNDLVYNNYVATPTTGWQVIINLYTGNYELFSDKWNIPVQSAHHLHYAPGFPLVPLVGSIIGTSWQGGNFWWDYGLTDNPYNGADNPAGQIPYTENATTPLGNSPYIYPGGDYAPLNSQGPP